MECCQGSSAFRRHCRSVPKASAKVKQIFELPKFFATFFIFFFREEIQLKKTENRSPKIQRTLACGHLFVCRKRLQSNGKKLEHANILREKMQKFSQENPCILIINHLHKYQFSRASSFSSSSRDNPRLICPFTATEMPPVSSDTTIISASHTIEALSAER